MQLFSYIIIVQWHVIQFATNKTELFRQIMRKNGRNECDKDYEKKLTLSKEMYLCRVVITHRWLPLLISWPREVVDAVWKRAPDVLAHYKVSWNI
jgi:hypothetical protein